MLYHGGIKSNVPSDNIYIFQPCDDDRQPVNTFIIVALGDSYQVEYFVNNFANLDSEHVIATFYNIFKEINLLAVVYNANEQSALVYNGVRRMHPISPKLGSTGTGMKFAIGAMEAGACAISALKIASKYDFATDGKHIQYIDLNQPSLVVSYLH